MYTFVALMTKVYQMKVILVIVSLFLLTACNDIEQGKWITGTEKEQLAHIENQFRGFDMAMVETGYRYQELYWAGQDKNWGYATYQVDKIKKTIENGLVRRPKRKQSAQQFLNIVLPEMKQAIAKKDTVIFNLNFDRLTNSCINCHAMEGVPSFIVTKPVNRQSPIQL